MVYGWREEAGGLVELCAECGFDARAVDDEQTALEAALTRLGSLLDHPDADRRPDAETWSAREYAAHVCEVTQVLLGYVCDATGHRAAGPVPDLPAARVAVTTTVPRLSVVDRAAPLADVYYLPVTVGWALRHLLHDVEHHVLDLRRNYARLALASLPGSWDAGMRR